MRPGDTGIGRKVLVGLVLRPVGLDGELKVRPLTDNPDRFAPGGRVWVEAKGGAPVRHEITAARETKGAFVVSLKGVSSVEDAEALRGREIYVPEEDVPPLPEGEYYHFQIIGIPVYTNRGRLLGKVRDIFTAGGSDVYVVEGGGGEYLVPATKDAVAKIDLKAGRITLGRLEGWIPEDEM